MYVYSRELGIRLSYVKTSEFGEGEFETALGMPLHSPIVLYTVLLNLNSFRWKWPKIFM
jgi:hypothetical protein